MATAGKKKKRNVQEDLAALTDTTRARGEALDSVKRQLRSVARIAVIALAVIWALALGFWSGLTSLIPIYIATVLTLAFAVAGGLIWRNLGKSQELGDLVGGSELSAEDRAERIGKLQSKVEKGDASAIIAKAQLQMQDAPRDALATLEKANLEKTPKIVANQIRAMRAMIHLNLADVQAARILADAIDLQKAPDAKTRANLAGVVAEAWARSNNPIEASELLDKYPPGEKDYDDVKVQLYRARAFSSAHRSDLQGMRRSLKQLEEVSPQLLAIFVGQKRVHPLLQKEAKKRLERSGLIPRQRIQGARR